MERRQNGAAAPKQIEPKALPVLGGMGAVIVDHAVLGRFQDEVVRIKIATKEFIRRLGPVGGVGVQIGLSEKCRPLWFSNCLA